MRKRRAVNHSVYSHRVQSATDSPRHPKRDVTHLLNIPIIFWTCWQRAIGIKKLYYITFIPFMIVSIVFRFSFIHSGINEAIAQRLHSG